MKKLYSILGNSQKLDGGAMFGNAPKAMWQKWVQVDELNRIDLACRTLLIKEESRNVLLEVGIGAFFDPQYKERYGVVESEHVLLDSLASVGLSHEDIDVIVLSHLHFDHIGGLLPQWQLENEPGLLFPNAQILIGEEAWERAYNPHPRDRASFIPEILSLLKSRKNVHLVDSKTHSLLGDDYCFHFSSGHTPGMMLTEIKMPDGPIVFCADLIPGEPWVHIPITMGYDRCAEKLIDEKSQLLSDLFDRNGRLFFTHDAKTALGRLGKNEKGRYCLTESFAELNSFQS
ncbi:MBL fold metallo-hydrolase [Aliikangiella maris]|uniref:MBL fold metallo-hydrolase n=2 Tax=Aliikangiella maris TaxID=3162458 RepID=A0ABV3MLV3_9GAMM